ncbi:MAG: hypothetical protein V3V35_06410 [Dehalococcoidia bacterium]
MSNSPYYRFVVAFADGLVSFVSPCVLPLVYQNIVTRLNEYFDFLPYVNINT